jgi:hypothetical protein
MVWGCAFTFLAVLISVSLMVFLMSFSGFEPL